MLVRQLIALGWLANGTAEEFGEIPALYELNQRMLDSRSWPAGERDRLLSHLKTPWVLKDPRMIDTWDFWMNPIIRKFGKKPAGPGHVETSPGTDESDLRSV